VLFPTLFLNGVLSERPEIRVALIKAYNRWLGDACSRGNGRFRWVVVPPLDDISESVRELEYGAKHGACGVLIRGVEGERVISDPSFHPLYEKASELDMPVCVHVGNGNSHIDPKMHSQDRYLFGVVPVLSAFNKTIVSGLPERFPKLRFGFIEAGAQWVPYMIRDALRRTTRLEDASGSVRDETTVMNEKRMYVACRLDDDLPYTTRWTGSNTLFIGTDFGHHRGLDPAVDLDALTKLRKIEGLDGSMVEKILDENARRFYAL
jgi:predicted TIM-barrel fold metal-dependent hydrolase